MALPQRAKHVVLLVENLPVPFDRRPWQIAQTLTQAGFAVSVICPQMYEHTHPYERIGQVEIHRYPSREGDTLLGWLREYANAIFWMFVLCLRLTVGRGIDAIHACNPPDLLFLVAWPFKVFFGARFVFDHHDLNPEVYLAKFGRRDRAYEVLCAMERATYRLADMALATNESFKRIAIARDGASPARVQVVRNAPMPGRLVPGPAKPELREGRSHLVAYLGVMNKQDGLDLLLESARYVVHDLGRRDLLFVLIGDGPELPWLKELAAKYDLADHVRFAGRISDGQILSDYLNTASVCVCPDPKNDMNDHSTMTKVVEYLAMGRAVVAYDLHETHFTAGDCALYATDNDTRLFGKLIVRLLDDEALRLDLGRRGAQRFAAMLSWDRSQKTLLDAYHRLLGRPNLS